MNLKEDIYKCSKCGLCKTVCPIFLAAKNELYLPRGRFILLNSLNGNFSSVSKHFLSTLDLCLNCNLCKEFCPSSIDSAFIFTEIKSQLKYKFSPLPFFLIFKTLLLIFAVLRFFYSVCSCFIMRSQNSSKCENNSLFPKLFKLTTPKSAKYDFNPNSKKGGNVIYFEGCFNKYINPSDKNACINIIKALGYNIVKIESNCCGYPLLSDGNIKQFNSGIKKIFSNMNMDFDYCICSCDSCFDTLFNAAQYDEKYKFIRDKLIRFDDFLKINNVLLKNYDALYYKPLVRKEECYLPQSVKILNKKGTCSLFENFFLIKHPLFTKKYFDSLFFNKNEINNKTIITSCNISKWGLIINSNSLKSNTNIISYSEYVMKNNF